MKKNIRHSYRKYRRERGASSITNVLILLGITLLVILLALWYVKQRSPAEVPNNATSNQVPMEEISYLAADNFPSSQGQPLTSGQLTDIVEDGKEAYDVFAVEGEMVLFAPSDILEAEEDADGLTLSEQQRQIVLNEQQRLQSEAPPLAERIIEGEAQISALLLAENYDQVELDRLVGDSANAYADLRTLVLDSKKKVTTTLTKEQIAQMAR
jgi:hypothetical protein